MQHYVKNCLHSVMRTQLISLEYICRFFFLNSLFEGGFAYIAINIARSVISSLLGIGSDTCIVSHLCVIKFTKGFAVGFYCFL